jgi:hypothetical protein
MHWRGPSRLYFCDHRKRIWSLSSVCHVSLNNLIGSKMNIQLTEIVQPIPKNSYTAPALADTPNFSLEFCKTIPPQFWVFLITVTRVWISRVCRDLIA